MDMIRLEGITHSWGGPPLLDGLDLVLREGDRLCLVGRNGAGKSTLLGILEGRIPPEGGVVWRQDTLRTASLPQDVPEDRSGDLLSAVLLRAGPAGEALLDHARALQRLELDPADDSAMQALERASAAIEEHDGWQIRQRVDEVLDLLALDPDADLQEASGGTVRRVLLAGALASDPDVLILDEPTNHLDIPTVERMEALLRRRRGALVFISHDRAFIDAVATRVVELDRGALQCEAPTFDAHLELRDAHLAVEADHRAAFDRNLAEEEAWLRQGVKARRTRNEGRVRRLEALRRERAQRRERAGQARITVQEAERSGRLVIEAKGVDWAWGESPVLSGFSTTILRGDKVGIIGPNGCGKTTLLRLLLGKLTPQRGTIRQGTNLQMAYFDQLREELNPDLSVWENVADGNDHITVDGRRRHVLGWLGDFLFRPERARSPVRVLSGGERHRLLLARLFTRPANLLVLDEPTNDLDMETLELLEDRLVSFEGTLLIVSHDRAFLNRVVSSTIAWEEGRGFREYVGGYDDWVRQRPAQGAGAGAAQGSGAGAAQAAREAEGATSAPALASAEPIATRAPAAAPASPVEGARRLKWKEARELESLPSRMEALEAEIAALEEALADPELYQRADAAQEVAALQARFASEQAALDAAMERWVELESIAEGGAAKG